MNSIETVMSNMKSYGDMTAIFWNGIEYSYNDFLQIIEDWGNVLEENNIGEGTVCAVLGDYSPSICSLFFALMIRKSILVPFTYAIEPEVPKFQEIAGVQCMFRFDRDDSYIFEKYDNIKQNELVDSFRDKHSPGLIVFSSGSTGKPKGILQDCEKVMHKFVTVRKGWKTILFLMMDHFGGFNTLFATFAYGGTGICIPNRSHESVCKVIEQSKANLLPTTPTFLNFLIASKSYKDYNLSSIEMITYGTELMLEDTLHKVIQIFPNAQVKQTYGMSELGVLRSKSENDDSVWVKIGGNGFETKIIDNILWIRSEANMVGYLNAQNPFDEEGWMCTGDAVEVNGEFIRFLGRKSEIINVGGQKVFPVEVENVLLKADNIKEAAVYGSTHPLMGQIVQAKVSLFEIEDPVQLSTRLRRFCLERMAKFKIPTRFVIVSEEEQRSERFKKVRK